MVNLWTSDISGSDVLDLLYIYLVRPSRRCAHSNHVLREVVGLSVAMIVHFSARDGHPLEKTGQRFMFHMRGVIS